ncbi:MAG: PAS domain S-box protein [Syntrophobacteraceae bacterium]
MMETETTPEARDPLVQRLAWLPVPVLLVAIVALWVADPRAAYESRSLLLLLNFLFTGLVTLCIGYLAGRSFLVSGQPGVLMLGSGALLWGTATMVASLLVKESGNLLVTVHNLGALGGAACHLTGLVWRGRVQRPTRWLAAAYGGVPAVVALLAWAAKAGWTPVFFIQGQGGTPFRQVTLCLTVGLFTLAAGMMLGIHRKKPSAFLYWYGLGLSLIALGLTGVMLQLSHGSVLGWTGRFAQFLGGAYLFTAAMATAREAGAWKLTLDAVEEAWRSEYLPGIRSSSPLRYAVRYGSALVVVGMAFVLRLKLSAWFGGELPPYITFYPAVMGVALLAGFGPGLAATATAMLAVDLWILPALNPSGVLAPIHRLSQVLFGCMGLAMSGLAELYRRDRTKAAAYERETALRESLARLATFAEASFEGIVESEQGRIMDCNDQLARILGYTVTELRGAAISDLVAPEDRECVMRNIREGQESAIEHSMIRKDGSRIMVEVRGRALTPGSARRITAVRDITPRKVMEEALKESEARYRELVQNANSAIVRWRADGTITFFNEYAQAFFGWNTDEILGRHASILVPETASSGTDLTGLVQDIVDHPERYVNNLNENICRDGRRVWMTWTNRAVRDDHGRVTEILAVGSDITERYHVEEALRRSEERLRLFVEHAPASLAMFDRQMRYVAFSRRWLSDYGLGERDLTGLSHYEVFPEISEHWKRVHRRGLAGEVVREDDDCFERADGSVQWLRWEVRPWRDLAGEVAGIVIFTEDVTELKRAQETRLRYNLLASQSRDIFLLVRRDDGRIMEANESAILAYGYTLDELFNMTIQDVRAPECREQLAGQLDEADQRGVLFETVHQRKDGSTFPVEVSARGADVGVTRCLVSVVRDITERKRTEVALRESEESLRASLAEKEVLLKEIHHRVKNNMQVISSLVALQANDSQDAGMRAVLQDVTHRVRSMAMVHEKLYQSNDLAQIEFAEYAQGLLNYLWRAHGSETSGIRLALDLEPVYLSVSAAVPCGLILNELVSNALKHAFRGTDGGEVVVSLRGDRSGQVRLSVRDNGTGLPAGLDWKQARSLGLRLVQMLSGQLRAAVEVSVDAGTCFVVSFAGRKE